jgi:hypothetical protein
MLLACVGHLIQLLRQISRALTFLHSDSRKERHVNLLHELWKTGARESILHLGATIAQMQEDKCVSHQWTGKCSFFLNILLSVHQENAV